MRSTTNTLNKTIKRKTTTTTTYADLTQSPRSACFRHTRPGRAQSEWRGIRTLITLREAMRMEKCGCST